MAYKRHIDRLPIPPKDAKVQNVTCPFCIVGCGYQAITWDVVARARSTREAAGEGKIPLPRQQRAHQSRPAVHLSRPVQRFRDGPLAAAVP
jgi:arsenite oxidase large subunit